MSKLIRTAETKENNKKREPIGTFLLTKSKAKDTEETYRRKVLKNCAEQKDLRYFGLENYKEGKTNERIYHESHQNEKDLNRDLSSRDKGALKDDSTSNERKETNDEYNTKLSLNTKMTKTHNLNKYQIQVTNQALRYKNI